MPQPVGLWKLMLYLFSTSNIQGKDLCPVSGLCAVICFKLGMKLDMTKLYSLNDLNVHSRSQGYWKARTCVVMLKSCMKQLKCSWWLIIKGRWLWRSPVSMADMALLSNCCSLSFGVDHSSMLYWKHWMCKMWFLDVYQILLDPSIQGLKGSTRYQHPLNISCLNQILFNAGSGMTS